MAKVEVHPLYERIDERNAAAFARYGSRVMTNQPLYTCVICGSPASVDWGYSCGGRNFVCGRCANERFETPLDALTWARGGDHGKEMP